MISIFNNNCDCTRLYACPFDSSNNNNKYYSEYCFSHIYIRKTHFFKFTTEYFSNMKIYNSFLFNLMILRNLTNNSLNDLRLWEAGFVSNICFTDSLHKGYLVSKNWNNILRVKSFIIFLIFTFRHVLLSLTISLL